MCLRLQPYVPEATWIGPASPRRPTRATRATPTRARSAGLRCLAPSARGVPAASSRTSRCAVCMSTRHMARPEYCSPACWKVASWCLPPPRGTPAHLGRTRRVLGGSAHRRARAAQVSTRGCGATARARHRLRLLHWLSMRRLGYSTPGWPSTLSPYHNELTRTHLAALGYLAGMAFYNCRNLTLTSSSGRGELNGNGRAWWQRLLDRSLLPGTG